MANHANGRGAEITGAIRDRPPCYVCTERFTACYDKCPKDLRGEFGYKAWKAEINRVNAERKKYDKAHEKNRRFYLWK